jgi:hypothetical protein
MKTHLTDSSFFFSKKSKNHKLPATMIRVLYAIIPFAAISCKDYDGVDANAQYSQSVERDTLVKGPNLTKSNPACRQNTESRQKNGKDRRSLFPIKNSSEITEIISEKKLSKAYGDARNPFEEFFYRDGNWSGQFAQTDIAEYDGIWRIKPIDSRSLLCVTILKSNGSRMNNTIEKCREIYLTADKNIIQIDHLLSQHLRCDVNISRIK